MPVMILTSPEKAQETLPVYDKRKGGKTDQTSGSFAEILNRTEESRKISEGPSSEDRYTKDTDEGTRKAGDAKSLIKSGNDQSGKRKDKVEDEDNTANEKQHSANVPISGDIRQISESGKPHKELNIEAAKGQGKKKNLKVTDTKLSESMKKSPKGTNSLVRTMVVELPCEKENSQTSVNLQKKEIPAKDPGKKVKGPQPGEKEITEGKFIFNPSFGLGSKKVKNEKQKEEGNKQKNGPLRKLKIIDLRKKGHGKTELNSAKESGKVPQSKPFGTAFINKENNFEGMLKDAVREPADRSSSHETGVSPRDLKQLSQHLKDTLNNKIVKQTGFILKGGGNGEIRLILRPEKLGNVRIRLELHDNNIAGKIFVENSSVRDVFQGNLDSLYKAFRESGFEIGQFGVSVGGEKADSGNGNGDPAKPDPKVIRRLEDTVPLLEEGGRLDYLVNLVV